MPATRIYWQTQPQFNPFIRELEQLFDRAKIPNPSQKSTPQSGVVKLRPRVELRENSQAYRVRVELPGVDRQNIEVSASDRTLKIVGRRHRDRPEDRPLVSEWRYGIFERVLSLPEAIDNTEVSADLDNGILSVILPKLSAQRPQSVKVRIGNAVSPTVTSEPLATEPTDVATSEENTEEKTTDAATSEEKIPGETSERIPSDLTDDVWVTQ